MVRWSCWDKLHKEITQKFPLLPGFLLYEQLDTSCKTIHKTSCVNDTPWKARHTHIFTGGFSQQDKSLCFCVFITYRIAPFQLNWSSTAYEVNPCYYGNKVWVLILFEYFKDNGYIPLGWVLVPPSPIKIISYPKWNLLCHIDRSDV